MVRSSNVTCRLLNDCIYHCNGKSNSQACQSSRYELRCVCDPRRQFPSTEQLHSDLGRIANPRPGTSGCVSCICNWLHDATGLNCGDRSWICNAPLILFFTLTVTLILCVHTYKSRSTILKLRSSTKITRLQHYYEDCLSPVKLYCVMSAAILPRDAAMLALSLIHI